MNELTDEQILAIKLKSLYDPAFPSDGLDAIVFARAVIASHEAQKQAEPNAAPQPVATLAAKDAEVVLLESDLMGMKFRRPASHIDRSYRDGYNYAIDQVIAFGKLKAVTQAVQ